MRIRSLWRVAISAAQDWWEDNCLRLTASLAYDTALGPHVRVPRPPSRMRWPWQPPRLSAKPPRGP
jgi:hypothetical protein